MDGRSVVELGSRETMLVITQCPTGAIELLTIVRNGKRRTVAVTVRAGSDLVATSSP